MTTSLSSAPEQVNATSEISPYSVLAMCAHQFRTEPGSNLLRRALLAQILADRHSLSPEQAIWQAMYATDSPAWDAGEERDRLIRAAEKADLAAQMGEVPA